MEEGLGYARDVGRRGDRHRINYVQADKKTRVFLGVGCGRRVLLCTLARVEDGLVGRLARAGIIKCVCNAFLDACHRRDAAEQKTKKNCQIYSLHSSPC